MSNQHEAERLAAEVGRLTAQVDRLDEALDALHRRLEHELAVARRIQLSLMPRALPQPSGWQIATAYRAAREVGGDFYDVYEIPGRAGRIGFVVADVTGKGVTAALMMAFTRAVLRSAAYNGDGPADALVRTNRVLVSDVQTGLFVTAFVGELDTATGRLRYSSAGHEPPLVIRTGGRLAEELDLPGSVLLGAFSDFEAVEASETLAPGELLVAYTDGVTDARDATGARFGDVRLRSALAHVAPGAAEAAVADVLTALDAFTGPEPATDDVTLLAVGRGDPDGKPAIASPMTAGRVDAERSPGRARSSATPSRAMTTMARRPNRWTPTASRSPWQPAATERPPS